jgi:uncharacterized Tic20 family protein
MTDPSSTPGSPPEQGSPPPGWYPDGTGQQRYWDGAQWGVAAPASTSVGPGGLSDEKGMATLAHVLAIFTGFLGPLIIWFVARDDQPFMKHHAAESLNFQILVSIAALISWVLMFVLIGFVIFPIVIIVALVFEIMGAMAANRGEWYRYPISLRLVPGARG